LGPPGLHCWRLLLSPLPSAAEPERHTWVNDPGLRAVDARAFAAASASRHHPRAARRSGRARQSVRVYRLDSGDRLRIVYSVETSGNVSMPLIGTVRGRGLSTVQLGLDIEAELRCKYIKDPKVSIEIDVYRPFFILGEVRRPGEYPYVNAMTVEGAVALAEGYTKRVKKRVMRLTRKFGGLMSTVMVPPDYPVQPGDTIYVLERIF
jgi:polysaccharide export outer membrane protein